MWDYIGKLRREAIQSRNNKNNGYTILKNIYDQLPFFACVNNLLEEHHQNDISRFIYTRDTNTPPFKGAYGETPHTWVQKYYIIKRALMIKEQELKERNKDGE